LAQAALLLIAQLLTALMVLQAYLLLLLATAEAEAVRTMPTVQQVVLAVAVVAVVHLYQVEHLTKVNLLVELTQTQIVPTLLAVAVA
jgi:hypothetical protein